MNIILSKGVSHSLFSLSLLSIVTSLLVDEKSLVNNKYKNKVKKNENIKLKTYLYQYFHAKIITKWNRITHRSSNGDKNQTQPKIKIYSKNHFQFDNCNK